MTRLLAALLLCASTLSAAVATLNLSPIPDGIEETPKVITFADLVTWPQIAGTVGYRIAVPIIQGTLVIRPLGSSGTGVEVVNGDVLNAGNEVVWTPPLNLSGRARDSFVVVAINVYESEISTSASVLVDLANVPDPLTISSGSFIQPDGTKVTEDTPYTFTWTQLAESLNAVSNVDPFQLRITGVISGSLSGETPIVLRPGQGLTWSPPTDVFTFDYEQPVAALTVIAENIGGDNPTAPATFSTPIIGVRETTSADETIDHVDPLIVKRGVPTLFTYEEIKAMIHGFTDLDRDAKILINLESENIPGVLVWQISGATAVMHADPSATLRPSDKIRILVPGNQDYGQYSITSFSVVSSYPEDNQLGIQAPNPRLIVVDSNSDNHSNALTQSKNDGQCGKGLLGLIVFVSCLAHLTLRNEKCVLLF
jgi:hypothetical protein